MDIRIIGCLLAVIGTVWSGGCNVIGFIAAPSPHDKKTPAEYDLYRTESRILVFVDQARSSGVGFQVRSALDAAVSTYLSNKVRIDKSNIIATVGYTPSLVQAYAGLSPAQIGRKAGADLVLYIRIDKYDLEQMDSRGFFSGSIATRSVLVDVDSAKIIWPASQAARLNRIKVDLEVRGRDAILNRLMSGNAHCITRYFYDCPSPKFRLGDEQKIHELDAWK